MGTCCARGYEKTFGRRQARRDARRYRRKGLDDAGQRLVDELAARGVTGATALEVGGGVGAIELELLRRGVRRATIVELSHGYDEEANALAREAGAEQQIERRHGDFVEEEAQVEAADLVVMHRVVCCFPDPERLVGTASQHARRLLALTFPRGTWWVRLGFRLANVWFRLSGGIEGFVHPPARIVSAAERSGLTLVVDGVRRPHLAHRRVRASSDDGADDGVGEAVVELRGPGAELAGDQLSAALEVGRVADSMAHADR